MFDVGVALAVRLSDVLDGDIVLQIDEGLAAARHFPEGLQRRDLGVGGRCLGRRCARPGTGIRRVRGSERSSDACRRRLAVTRGGSEPERARDRASGRAEPVGQHRGERGEILAPLQRAARLRGERGLRLVATGEQHAVGLDGRQGLAIAAGDLHGAHLATALDGRDHRAMMHGDADRAGARGGSRCGPRIDDRRDAHARLVQRDDALIGPVVVGEQHRSLRDRDTIAAQIGEGGTGKHNARPVVPGAGDPALVGAGREQHATRTDDAQTFARRCGCAAALCRWGQSLHRCEHAVVVGADDLRAGQHA